MVRSAGSQALPEKALVIASRIKVRPSFLSRSQDFGAVKLEGFFVSRGSYKRCPTLQAGTLSAGHDLSTRVVDRQALPPESLKSKTILTTLQSESQPSGHADDRSEGFRFLSDQKPQSLGAEAARRGRSPSNNARGCPPGPSTIPDPNQVSVLWGLSRWLRLPKRFQGSISRRRVCEVLGGLILEDSSRKPLKLGVDLQPPPAPCSPSGLGSRVNT